MSLSFSNRTALSYMIATAIVIAVVFGVVYIIVQNSVYKNIDSDLSYEAEKHTLEIEIIGDSIKLINSQKWEADEHKEVQVNPVFLQIIDKDGQLMGKSPNLKENKLSFKKDIPIGNHFNSILNQREIRQAQIPINQGGEIKGYIITAMSLESSIMVILNLRNILLISYPIILLGLFFISRYLAAKSISPIKNITETTNRITNNNLKERVALPEIKDELYDLSSSINELLLRIENAIERERQFTSDASHELRTPLTSMRGTLEVLIRKSRTENEYKEKVNYSLTEIDRMTVMIEQLLLLARFNTNSNDDNQKPMPLVDVIDGIISLYSQDISKKKMKVNFDTEQNENFVVPQYYSNLLFDNLINNAIKYSKENGSLFISIKKINDKFICEIKDEGIGIEENDLKNIFNPFFRSEALNHKNIKGTGLGLSIAKKAAEAIQANLSLSSKLGIGTTFTIKF